MRKGRRDYHERGARPAARGDGARGGAAAGGAAATGGAARGAARPVGAAGAALAVAFAVALALLDHRDARNHALIFTAWAGALMVVPVFFAARALFAAPRAAFAAALLAAVIPAHLHRTYALWLRYDALGSLLALTHVALVLASLAAPARPRARLLAALGALALLAAVAC